MHQDKSQYLYLPSKFQKFPKDEQAHIVNSKINKTYSIKYNSRINLNNLIFIR